MLSKKIISKNIKEHVIFGFDTETTPDGDMYMAWVTTPTNSYFFEDKFKLIDFFKGLSGDIWIVGHNIAYDLNTMFPEYFPERHEWGGRFIYAETGEKSGVFFIDLFNYIQKKEKDIAKEFGCEYIDQHFQNDPDIKKACFTHAETGRLYLTHIQNIYLEMGGQLKFTASSSALELFIRNYLPYDVRDYHPTHKNEDDLTDDEIKQLTYKSYHGGATEIFRKGYFENVVMLDVRSMYPKKMLLPMPDLRKWYYSCDEHIFPKVLEKFEGAVCADFIIPEMLIPPFIYTYEHELNKVVSHCGSYPLHWITFPEMRYIISLGAKISKIWEFVYYQRDLTFFTPFINDMWKHKTVKRTKNWAKLNMNGVGGKFGQRNLENSAYIEIEDLDEVDIEDFYTYNEVLFEFVTTEPDKLKFNKKAYPIMISYITAYARIYLHECMNKIGFENILYGDTDSLAIINRTVEQLQSIVTIGENLGDFEVQWEGAMELRGLKYYRYIPCNKALIPDKPFEWVYKIKGVGDKYQEEFWKNERVVVSIPRKIRTAIRTGKKVNQWFDKPYVSKNKQDKRIFDKEGRSEPYRV